MSAPIHLSTFRSCFDNKPVSASHPSWSSFADWLESQFSVRERAERKHWTACVTPCVYEPGTTRAKHNAVSWNWFAADIDNKGGNQPGSSMEEVGVKCATMGVPFIIYTTTSSAIGAECFRLMFPLNRVVDYDEFPSLWGSVAAWLGCVDEGTKDISRLFVAPRQWDGSDPLFFRHDEGAALDVDLLKFLHPMHLPPVPSRSHIRQFADTSDLKEVCPSQLTLSGDFVSGEALAKAQSGTPGKRMFGFLVSVGTRAMLKGYAIEPADLATMGRELARTMNRHTDDIDHDAQSAFEIALSHYASAKSERFEKLVTPHAAYLAKWGKKS